jgi:hypothetical protein
LSVPCHSASVDDPAFIGESAGHFDSDLAVVTDLPLAFDSDRMPIDPRHGSRHAVNAPRDARAIELVGFLLKPASRIII